jgi:hypothetical protein
MPPLTAGNREKSWRANIWHIKNREKKGGLNNVVSNNLLTSSRIFLYLGIALVALAIITFPTRIPLEAQPMDPDYYSVGWLFAPIIGVWGLASIVLGLVHSPSPKRTIEVYLLPVLAVVTVGLAFATYMVAVFGSGIIRSVGRGEPFWWLYFVMVLSPSLLIYTSAVKFLRSKERIDFLASQKVRVATFVTLAAVPLSYTAGFFARISGH